MNHWSRDLLVQVAYFTLVSLVLHIFICFRITTQQNFILYHHHERFTSASTASLPRIKMKVALVRPAMNQWRSEDKTSWKTDVCGISHTPSGVFLLILTINVNPNLP